MVGCAVDDFAKTGDCEDVKVDVMTRPEFGCGAKDTVALQACSVDAQVGDESVLAAPLCVAYVGAKPFVWPLSHA